MTVQAEMVQESSDSKLTSINENCFIDDFYCIWFKNTQRIKTQDISSTLLLNFPFCCYCTRGKSVMMTFVSMLGPEVLDGIFICLKPIISFHCSRWWGGKILLVLMPVIGTVISPGKWLATFRKSFGGCFGCFSTRQRKIWDF